MLFYRTINDSGQPESLKMEKWQTKQNKKRLLSYYFRSFPFSPLHRVPYFLVFLLAFLIFSFRFTNSMNTHCFVSPNPMFRLYCVHFIQSLPTILQNLSLYAMCSRLLLCRSSKNNTITLSPDFLLRFKRTIKTNRI